MYRVSSPMVFSHDEPCAYLGARFFLNQRTNALIRTRFILPLSQSQLSMHSSICSSLIL